MNNLKDLRESYNLNKKEMALKLNLPYTTYVGYENEARDLNSEVLSHISHIFGVSTDYILGLTSNPVNTKLIGLEKNEYQHIKKYRSLDDHGKELVDTILDKEYERCNPGEEEMVTLRIAARSKDNSTGLQTVKVSKADMDAANDLLKIIPPSDPGV